MLLVNDLQSRWQVHQEAVVEDVPQGVRHESVIRRRRWVRLNVQGCMDRAAQLGIGALQRHESGDGGPSVIQDKDQRLTKVLGRRCEGHSPGAAPRPWGADQNVQGAGLPDVQGNAAPRQGTELVDGDPPHQAMAPSAMLCRCAWRGWRIVTSS